MPTLLSTFCQRHSFSAAFFFICVLAVLLRFLALEDIPNGLYQDETAIGYNAYSILQTGKDEWGKLFPLYFKSFGDYKLPVYIYLDVLAVKLFGLTEFAVRLPSAVFGVGSVLVLYFLVKELTKDKKLALVAMLLMAVNPWHLHYSRATFEVSISLFLFLLGTFLLQKAFSKKNLIMFLGGTFCFILDIYTYNLTRLLSPLLYLLVLWYNRDQLKTYQKRDYLLTIIFSAICLTPLFLSLFDKGGINSAKGTLIFSSQSVLASLLEFRGYFVNLPTIVNKLVFNNLFLTLWQLVKNLISYFSVDFYFIKGSTHGNHGIGTAGQFYLFEFITISLGVFWTIVKKYSWGQLLAFWFLLVAGVASLTREAPHATRSFFLLFPLLIFSAQGFLVLWEKLIKLKKPLIKLTIGSVFSIFIFFNLVYYFGSYYLRFPVSYASSWKYNDREVMKYINKVVNDYDEIFFSENSGFVYTSYLFYNSVDPQVFQNSVLREPDDVEGFSKVLKFGKVNFKKINWQKDSTRPPKRLFIVKEQEKIEGVNPLQTFYLPKRPVVISVKEQIFQYPVEEVAYYVYESPEQK